MGRSPCRVVYFHIMEGSRLLVALRRLRQAFPILVVLVLWGCPYTSDQPLSDPSAAVIDPSLIGAWRTRDADSGEWHRITFYRFNDHEMVCHALGDSPGEVSLSRLFLTEIGGQRFLNIKELGSDDEPWYFALLVLEGDRCVIRLIDDGLLDSRVFGSTEERREFIRARLADPLLYAPVDETPMEIILERVRETG